MKKLLAALLVSLTCAVVHAEPLKTVFNPFTGKLDYITRIDSNTVSAGGSCTSTSNSNGTVTVTCGGGGASSLGVNYNGVVVTSPTALVNFTGSGVSVVGSGSTATVTISGSSGGASSLGVNYNGVSVSSPTSLINFTGIGLSLTGSGSTSTIAIPNLATPILPTGAHAQYNFLQGTGTVVTDLTGNGNNANFCTSTPNPVWLPYQGLNFPGTQGTNAGTCVNLPTALNNDRTILFDMYVQPPGPGTLAYPYAGAFGTYIYIGNNSSGGVATQMTIAIDPHGNKDFGLYSNHGNAFTICNQGVLGGYHNIGVTMDGTLDHIYIDGQECPNYYQQQSNYGYMPSTANYTVGGSTTGVYNPAFIGTFYNLATYTSALSASQVITALAAMQSATASRPGVSIVPVQNLQYGNSILDIGDSLSCGYNLSGGCPGTASLTVPSVAWGSQLVFDNPSIISTATVKMFGFAGLSANEIQAYEPWMEGEYCKVTNGIPPIAMVNFGSNDLVSNGGSVVDLQGNLAKLATQLKSQGCVPFVGSMTSRNAATGISGDTEKNLFNPILRKTWKNVMGFSQIMDFGSDPRVAADLAYANTTYFTNDQVHPSIIGQTLFAQIASNSLNYYLGSQSKSPTIVQSTYTIRSSDVQVIVSSATPSQTLTLADCRGPSGGEYYINNITTNTLAVATSTQTVQLINGSSNPITIPPNTSVKFLDVPSTPTISGCGWSTWIPTVSTVSSGGGSSSGAAFSGFAIQDSGSTLWQVTISTSGNLISTSVGSTTSAYYYPNTFVLVDTHGIYWQVNISTLGTLTTTSYSGNYLGYSAPILINDSTGKTWSLTVSPGGALTTL